MTCEWSKESSTNPEVDQYLSDVAKYLAAFNPKTFKDKFAIEHICIYVQPGAKSNAVAIRNLNTINVNSGLVLVALSDAEIASALAHELAHLTMQSDDGEDVPPEVLRSPDWPKVRENFEFQYRDASGRLNGIEQHIAMIQEQMRSDSLAIARAIDSDALLQEGYKLQSLYNHLLSVNLMTYVRLPIPLLADRDELLPTLTTDELASLAKSFASQRTAFIAKLEKVAPASVKNWQDQQVLLLTAFGQTDVVQTELGSYSKQFDSFIASLAGPGARYNWREQQADEVGYELYLRAGFEPTFMPWLERNNMPLEDYQKCLKEHVAKGIPPSRENTGHPTDCWRIYDLLYLEARYHAEDYKNFFATAHTVEIPTPAFTDRLDNVKRALQQ